MDPPLQVCVRMYRRLAGAYPHEFRMLYGEDLDRLGEDAIPEVWRRYRLPGLLRLLADIAVRLPAMYLAEIRQDVTYALRLLARAPGFTGVAVLSLAVGIGMCSAVLSEVQAIVGPPPGVRDPASLFTMRYLAVSYPYFEHYREQVAAAAVMGPVPFAVAFTADKSARAERFYGHVVSPEYFSILGVAPARGRFFAPDTERFGMPPVVVVSDRFWRAQLSADPHAVGRTLRLNGWMATIVGIGPKDFLGVWPAHPADLFVPVTCAAALAPELSGDALHRAGQEIFRVVIRLPDRTSPQTVEAALDAITRHLDRQDVSRPEGARKGRLVNLMPAGTIMYITPEQRGFVNTFHVVLWALVLLLVCANLSNLLLARAGDRRREIAVRLSVGASRPRLVRQFLTESVLLSFAGGLGGIVLAYTITHVIAALPVPSPTPIQLNCRPDASALAITLAIALASGVAFGLMPALSAVRGDIGATLKEGAQTALRGYRRFGLRNLFVIGQMGASLMLVLFTWFVVLGFRQNARSDPGFDIANLNLISLDPVRDGYSLERAAALFTDLPDELARTSGVRGVSVAQSVPFASLYADAPNARVAASGAGGQELRAVLRERIGPNYFATLGVPLLGGREFDRRDEQENPPSVPVIINQAAARELFGTANPIGRPLRAGEVNYTVVGLTRDVQSGGILMSKSLARVWLPLTAGWFRKNPAERLNVLVRGTAGRDTLAAVRTRLASLYPDLTVFGARTVREDLERLNSFIEWDSVIYIVLGLFALFLACIGLGGVTAYAVARRQKEIGIRMALGARASRIQWLVLREGLALVAAGSALGFAGAFLLVRVFAAHSDVLARTFGKRADDPLLLIGAPLLLAALAVLACYLPARRGTRLDPAAALRQE